MVAVYIMSQQLVHNETKDVAQQRDIRITHVLEGGGRSPLFIPKCVYFTKGSFYSSIMKNVVEWMVSHGRHTIAKNSRKK